MIWKIYWLHLMAAEGRHSSVTAYTAVRNYNRQLNSFASIIEPAVFNQLFDRLSCFLGKTGLHQKPSTGFSVFILLFVHDISIFMICVPLLENKKLPHTIAMYGREVRIISCQLKSSASVSCCSSNTFKT